MSSINARPPAVAALKVLSLAIVIYAYAALAMGNSSNPASLIVLFSAVISSIAGFAFSAISGSMLLHVVSDPVKAVQIMLVASIALQAYSVWVLRKAIRVRELLPYFAGGLLTVVPGAYLLLNTPTAFYLLALGAFLTAYGTYMLICSPVRLEQNSLMGRIFVGALGGITGATAAFPGAFVTLWCAAHKWEKQHQRAIYQPFILGMQLITLAVLTTLSPAAALHAELLQYAVPAVLGSHLGLSVFNILNAVQFNKIVSAFLLVSGVLMLAKAL